MRYQILDYFFGRRFNLVDLLGMSLTAHALSEGAYASTAAIWAATATISTWGERKLWRSK